MDKALHQSGQYRTESHFGLDKTFFSKKKKKKHIKIKLFINPKHPKILTCTFRWCFLYRNELFWVFRPKRYEINHFALHPVKPSNFLGFAHQPKIKINAYNLGQSQEIILG
jgi:hypothetical protein